MAHLVNTLAEAIKIQQNQQDSDYKAIMDKPIQDRIAKGHTLSNLTVEIYPTSGNSFLPPLPDKEYYIGQVEIECPDNRSRFREGSVVVLSNGNYKFKMTVIDDGITSMILESNSFDLINNHLDIHNCPKTGWEINELNQNINQRLLSSACNKIASNEELEYKLESLLDGKYDNIYAPVSIVSSDDETQDLAISKALGCSYFHLIQGPPGTGKTTTIAKIVSYLLHSGKRIFITCPTHTAINNCLNAICNIVEDPTKVVKIGDNYQTDGIENNKFKLFLGSDAKFLRFLYKLNSKFAINYINKKMSNNK